MRLLVFASVVGLTLTTSARAQDADAPPRGAAEAPARDGAEAAGPSLEPPEPPEAPEPSSWPKLTITKDGVDGEDDESVSFNLDVGDVRRARDDLDLAPETVARLSEEQLFELLMAKQNKPDVEEEVYVPFVFFGTILGVTALVLVFRHRREQLRHETIRISIERGHPISPDLLVPERTSTLRRGLVLLGTGLGLAIMLAGTSGQLRVGTVGLLPACIGAAYLAVWWLEVQSKQSRDDARSARRPLGPDDIP